MFRLRGISFLRKTCSRLYAAMFQPLEFVTGREKQELLAHIGGNCDPFYIRPVKKGPGTRELPNLIPSVYSYRMVGCRCSEHQHHIEYMCLHAGSLKRCGCGHWFQLCPVPKIVET